jgi:biotin transport system substrate-specific component
MHSSTAVSLGISRPDLTLLEEVRQTLPGRIVIAISATALVAACAHVSLRLPFTPVPLTLQDFAVLLVGLVLGPMAAFSAMVLYLAEGAVGLPVFTPQGPGGIAQLMGPTAGFLFSYPLAAAVAGLAGSFKGSTMSSFTSAVVSCTLATGVIFAFGAGWIGHTRFLSASSVWYVAVAPFLFGAAAKVVGAAFLFGATRRWTRS